MKIMHVNTDNPRTIIRLTLLAAVLVLPGCATTQEKEETIQMTKVDDQAFQPVTRLAFVDRGEEQRRIELVKAKPQVVNVSEIESAAGPAPEEPIEH
jgi:uncharacterized lipoprotein YajG